MSPQRMAPWRLILYTYPCPTCGARPGQWCVTKSGRQADMPHAARAEDAMGCQRCGTRLPIEATGPLCEHCQLVRDLVTEAHRTHKRADP